MLTDFHTKQIEIVKQQCQKPPMVALRCSTPVAWRANRKSHKSGGSLKKVRPFLGPEMSAFLGLDYCASIVTGTRVTAIRSDAINSRFFVPALVGVSVMLLF